MFLVFGGQGSPELHSYKNYKTVEETKNQAIAGCFKRQLNWFDIVGYPTNEIVFNQSSINKLFQGQLLLFAATPGIGFHGFIGIADDIVVALKKIAGYVTPQQDWQIVQYHDGAYTILTTRKGGFHGKESYSTNKETSEILNILIEGIK